MRKTAILAAIFAATLVFVTSSHQVSAAKQPEVKSKQKVAVVQPGDSLSLIAASNKTTYERLFFANTKIQDPNIIHPGEKVRIPANKEKLKKRPLVGAVAQVAPVNYTTGSVAPAAPRVQQKAQPAVTASAAGVGVWDQIAACESGGNWAINTGNGYYGGLQFSLGSWRAVGGSGLPSQASKSEQIMRGQILQARQGWGAWPACTARLGLR